ncbi:TadE family type IV pilus minor pilin [Subtercola lobariae]|uniref:Pilus assembly protein TadE n=1 Tax=Subtercola lobariae TaxID=1588641 RepID=A0A917EVQ6_9MICO|nr:TadE family type IV pilus minor pilin [Subtercola lobariae]GGF13274.1 hypothetical protein GCM10011399_03970 [Subtercola lobariae]
MRTLADERGTVTAEFAAALPAVGVVLILALGAIQASALQLRVVDAASIAARSLGRAESSADADARVSTLLGAHEFSSSTDGDFVCASVSAPIALGGFSATGLSVSARSCALAGGK